MLTFQDFEESTNKEGFILNAINQHLTSFPYKVARSADLYDRQMNETIHSYVQMIFSLTGEPIEDFTASNNKIASNFFHRLNTQRCTYLLGNGVSFTNKKETIDENGVKVMIDTTKEKLGSAFDNTLKKIGYNALIHGVCYGFWNVDTLYMFSLTEFVPLLDEETGILRAGIRFWRLDPEKPMMIVLYEEDGFTKYKTKSENGGMVEIQPKKAYKTKILHTEIDGDVVIGEENYSSLPVIPLYGSSKKQSTLIGMREAIDSFDLIRSGFANDLTDCSQIYWIIENCGGMSDDDLARFRDRLKINHIANVDTNNGKATPYTQDIPFQARKEYLDEIRAGIYEDFGGLDVHTIAAGATNDHIDAAYQPMDEEADDFEYQVIEFLQQILNLMGINDVPQFKRNRISNQKEQVEMVMLEANYLDDETILSKLPNITVDEINGILARKELENYNQFDSGIGQEEEQEEIDELQE